MWKSLSSFQHLSIVVLNLALVLLCCWGPCGAKPKGELCLLNGEHYNVGETWNPKNLPVDSSCVNCSCLEGGEVKCTSVACTKPDCQDPKFVPGECCAICEVEVEEAGRPEVSAPPGCDYDGSHYEDGEMFPSNKTAFTPLHDQQCVLCACYKDEVFCHLKTCTVPPGCLKMVKVSEDCCRQCEEYAVDSTPSEMEQLEPGDCMSTMGPQKNGTTWKPVVGQYGEMECVVCSCQNTRVHCSRVQCPSESSFKCKRPELKKGNCCRECPNGRRKGRRRVEGKKKKKEREKNKKRKKPRGCRKVKDGQKKKRKERKRKKRCRKRLKKTQPMKTPSAQNTSDTNNNNNNSNNNNNNLVMTMAMAKSKLCAHKKADYFVYVIKGKHSYSLILDSVRGDNLEKTDWLIRKDWKTSSKNLTSGQKAFLRRKTSVQDLIGTTDKRNIKKFFNKLKRKQDKCKRTRCRGKILSRSLNKIKVKAINLKKSC